jgi:hypothetical protein
MSSVTVVVVVICGGRHTERCVKALVGQRDAPPFEIVVAHSPSLPGIPDALRPFAAVRAVSEPGRHTPIDLAALGLREARGETVLLTEDHCVPSAGWVRVLSGALSDDRAAVGGTIEPAPLLSPLGWAFYFVDFFRYMKPVREGPAPSISSCNAAYRRADLAAIRGQWERGFHETAVHEALRRPDKPLWQIRDATVEMGRNVSFAPAIRERYQLGRLFGARRLEFVSPAKRLLYGLAAPALPFLLAARYLDKAQQRREILGRLARCLPQLMLLTLAWSWGEWLGYLTARAPQAIQFAPEAETGSTSP